MARSILVVDDEVDVVRSMKNILERRGFNVLTAYNGVEALQEMQKQRPDLILSDVLMPQMDGYAFYKELKKNPGTRRIPVLIVTARGQMEDTFKVIGVDGFIVKPFSPEDLCKEIENILAISGISQPEGADKKVVKKVLVIGKEQALLDDITRGLHKGDCDCLATLSSTDSVGKALQFNPDIIAMDVQLSDMPSVELVEVFRRLPKFGAKLILGFSFYRTEALNDPLTRQKVLDIEEDSKKFLQAGGSQYLGRFNEYNLIKAISEATANPPAKT